MTGIDSDVLFSEAVQRLREAAHQDRAFDAAKMQLINLPEIIKNAGAHWPLVKDKIRLGSLTFLKGCLSDDDIVIPAGDGFLIIFAEGDSAGLKRRAQELRGLLLEFYLGQETLNKLKIDVRCQTVRADQLHTLLAPSPQLSKEASSASQLEKLPDLSFVFAPIWTLRAGMIGSYLCTPLNNEPFGPRYGYDENYPHGGQSARRDFLSIDMALLDAVEAALDRNGSDTLRPALGVQVHATTMASRNARAEYLERLSRTPKSKLKHMFVRIAQVDVGTPMINIANWVGMLRARTRHVQVEFHYSQTPPAQLADVGVFSAGFQSPTIVTRGRGDFAKASVLYQRWGAAFMRQRLTLFIDSVRQPALIKAAVDSGVGFITNETLWPYAEWPGGILSDVNPLEAPEPDIFLSAS